MRSSESNDSSASGGAAANFSAVEAAADKGIVLELKKIKVLGRGQFGIVSEGIIDDVWGFFLQMCMCIVWRS